MSKPKVFFSHSSRDKEMMVRLKDAFVAKTNGTIEVFLSSDGESIPFGSNWVHRVESGLAESELMFLLITPNSLLSNWLYFEAGHAYSRDKSVVPVGFHGVDIGQIGAPLNLLQGFNVNSADTLNNLIATVNKQFQHSHAECFTEADYQEILRLGGESAQNPLYPVMHLLDEVSIHMEEEGGTLHVSPHDAFAKINGILDKRGIECFPGDLFLYLPGAAITGVEGPGPGSLTIRMDPMLLHVTMPIVGQILDFACPSKPLSFALRLVRGLDLVTVPHNVTARLHGSSVRMVEKDEYALKDLKFKLSPVQESFYSPRLKASAPMRPASIEVTCSGIPPLATVANLLGTLASRGVICDEATGQAAFPEM